MISTNVYIIIHIQVSVNPILHPIALDHRKLSVAFHLNTGYRIGQQKGTRILYKINKLLDVNLKKIFFPIAFERHGFIFEQIFIEDFVATIILF